MQEIITGDGTPTLFNEEFNESYHSLKCGALTEACEKYIKPIFAYQDRFGDKIKILDVCFGLGYNAFSALLFAKKAGIDVEIISPEINESLPARLLNFEYPKEFDEIKSVIEEVIKNGEAVFEGSSIKIVFGDLRKTLPLLEGGFNAVFQDAFSPNKNPALWSVEYFILLRSKMADFGVLTTYSQANAVRLSLKEADFFVHDLPLNAPIRSGTIAATKLLGEYVLVDMEAKKALNPNLEVLRDF